MIFNNVPNTESFSECIPTNGDMIKALFPNSQIDYHEKSELVDRYVTVFINGCDTCQDYPWGWWNTPYKKGGR